MIEYFEESELIRHHKTYMEKEGRYKFFEMARNLLSGGYHTEGMFLLLFGWNSAYLAKLLGKFRLDNSILLLIQLNRMVRSRLFRAFTPLRD